MWWQKSAFTALLKGNFLSIWNRFCHQVVCGTLYSSLHTFSCSFNYIIKLASHYTNNHRIIVKMKIKNFLLLAAFPERTKKIEIYLFFLASNNNVRKFILLLVFFPLDFHSEFSFKSHTVNTELHQPAFYYTFNRVHRTQSPPSLIPSRYNSIHWALQCRTSLLLIS